ncbi:CLIP domain-containing serine protease 14D-like [Chelonus insularis]|uniref:CLIP domain-containing serine protease 14D-like n=1 Tax=Chelonus insularis TaxID=460826 RepID=UPI00158B6978|nr:CLIP domain-containing serine protease 14D-like [Chelonus insularis]
MIMRKVSFFLHCIILCITLASITAIDENESCTTPDKKDGICIILPECSALMKLLKNRRTINETSLNFLRESKCGFKGMTPKVCCKEIPPNEIIQFNSQDKLILSSLDSSDDEIKFPDTANHPNLKYLKHDICGPMFNGKIMGGAKTSVIDYPWMALLSYDFNGTKEFKCGGSIINERYILTAAHCVTNLSPPLTLDAVRIGEHNLNTDRDCDRDNDGNELVCSNGHQDFNIEEVHYHPEFNSRNLKNDIGLIRVDRPIDFSQITIKPICLPIGPTASHGPKRFTVLGWGSTERGPRSNELLQVTLARMNYKECAKRYPRYVTIWYKHICAGGRAGKDSCGGDSGGPLLAPALYYDNIRYVQYGIVSFGHRRCGTDGVPGVYTKIVFYLDWVLDNIKP